MRGAIFSAVVLALTATPTPAFASGTGPGGGFGQPNSFEVPGGSRSPEERLERRGKSQVRKRITCKKCEYHNRLNQQTAAEVAQAVREGKFELRDRDRRAVLFYLNRRYGV